MKMSRLPDFFPKPEAKTTTIIIHRWIPIYTKDKDDNLHIRQKLTGVSILLRTKTKMFRIIFRNVNKVDNY